MTEQAAEPSASRAALAAYGPPGPVLIGLAHGSRHAGAGPSLARLLAAVAERAGRRGLDLVTRSAFLDILSPDLGETAGRLVGEGRREAVAVPLLFTSAFHATVDVPQTAREAVERSGLELRIAPILGTGEEVLEVLETVLEDEGVPGGTEVLLYAVGSSDEAANDAVRDLAARLGRRRGVRVRACFGTRPPRGAELLDALVAAGDRPVVLPLFTAPGLLLDPMIAAAERHGVRITAPLEARLAELVLARYRATASR